MKKILLFCLLAVMSIASKAQVTLDVLNRTTCPIKITPFCYDKQCNVLNTCSSVVIGPNTGQGFNTCGCDPQYKGYIVCWDDPACSTICVTIAAPGPNPGCFPAATVLPACGNCRSLTGGPSPTVSFGAGGEMIIQ